MSPAHSAPLTFQNLFIFNDQRKFTARKFWNVLHKIKIKGAIAMDTYFLFSPMKLKQAVFMMMRKLLWIKFLALPIKWKYSWRDILRHDLFAHVAKVKLLSRKESDGAEAVKGQETCSCYFTGWTGKIPPAAANHQ